MFCWKLPAIIICIQKCACINYDDEKLIATNYLLYRMMSNVTITDLVILTAWLYIKIATWEYMLFVL